MTGTHQVYIFSRSWSYVKGDRIEQQIKFNIHRAVLFLGFISGMDLSNRNWITNYYTTIISSIKSVNYRLHSNAWLQWQRINTAVWVRGSISTRINPGGGGGGTSLDKLYQESWLYMYVQRYTLCPFHGVFTSRRGTLWRERPGSGNLPLRPETVTCFVTVLWN